MEEQISTANDRGYIKFDDLNKLDKPNIDWVITEALLDVRRARAISHTPEGKIFFISAIEALVEVSSYYWFLDPDFENRLKLLDVWANQELLKFPQGSDNDIYGRSKLDLNFQLAMKKWRLVMYAIVKSSKKIPIEDVV